METIDIVGLPSGEIMRVSEDQFKALREEGLVIRIIKYNGIFVDKYCYKDSKTQYVKSVALASILDNLKGYDEL